MGGPVNDTRSTMLRQGESMYRRYASTARGSSSARIVAVAAIAIALASGVHSQQQTRISITTGGTGGVYYPMGGGMANILSKYVPGLTATAEVTGGSVDNLKLISAGKSEVGFSMVDAGWDCL